MQAFPTLLVVTEPTEATSDVYQGELKIDRITKFLNNYSYKSATFEKKVEIQELTSSRLKTQGLCAKKSSNICLILFLDHNNLQALDELRSLLDFYKNDPLSFTFVNT